MKLYFLDNLETPLNKKEIEERVRSVSVEDKFWNIDVRGKVLCRAKFEEDAFSCFYLPATGKSDMLSPRIHVTIEEKMEGCVLDISYSRTWGFLYIFIFWSCLLLCAGMNYFVHGNVLIFMCYAAVYILGIWMARKHRINICNKVVNILKEIIHY